MTSSIDDEIDFKVVCGLNWIFESFYDSKQNEKNAIKKRQLADQESIKSIYKRFLAGTNKSYTIVLISSDFQNQANLHKMWTHFLEKLIGSF